MVDFALARYGALPAIDPESEQWTCIRLRAYSCLIKDDIELLEREIMTMIPLCDSWTGLPAWLKRRKTNEQQDMEVEALRVADRWGRGGECLDKVTAVRQRGEGIVLEVERWLGVEHDQLAEDEDQRFCITWDHRS